MTKPPIKRGNSRLSFETLLALRIIAVGLPAFAVLSLALWLLEVSLSSALITLGAVLITWLGLAFTAQRSVVFHLYTLANLLEALREGDYSLRGRRARRFDALGEVFFEVNALGDTLRRQRFKAHEATTLLFKIVSEIDIAVIAFDAGHRVRMSNPAAARLLGFEDPEQLEDLDAASLGLEDFLARQGRRIAARRFAGGTGRWDVWTSTFREGGLPHHLLVISDLSHALRDEERRAWRALVRVIGHELNNTLTPIKTLAEVLHRRLHQDAAASRKDVTEGLAIIAERAEALNRFMSAYAMLAKLPDPNRREVDLAQLMPRVAAVDERLRVSALGQPMTIQADPDQLERLMINLIKNGIDAAGDSGEVTVTWQRARDKVVIEVTDNGPGPVDSENLFVPFFTTKPHGTGIGLALSRQIAEAHGGHLSLRPRPHERGAVARLELPLA